MVDLSIVMGQSTRPGTEVDGFSTSFYVYRSKNLARFLRLERFGCELQGVPMKKKVRCSCGNSQLWTNKKEIQPEKMSAWWFQTWMDDFPFHLWDVFPLTNSIIFQDGYIKPPSRCGFCEQKYVDSISRNMGFLSKTQDFSSRYPAYQELHNGEARMMG